MTCTYKKKARKLRLTISFYIEVEVLNMIQSIGKGIVHHLESIFHYLGCLSLGSVEGYLHRLKIIVLTLDNFLQ